jgi:hypothetical protein
VHSQVPCLPAPSRSRFHAGRSSSRQQQPLAPLQGKESREFKACSERCSSGDGTLRARHRNVHFRVACGLTVVRCVLCVLLAPQAVGATAIRPATMPLEVESSAKQAAGPTEQTYLIWNRRHRRRHRRHLKATCRRAPGFLDRLPARGASAPRGGRREHHWDARSARICNILPVRSLLRNRRVIRNQWLVT